MLLDGGLHRIGVRIREHDQVARRERIVLRLRHQIDGDQRRVGGLVRHHAHLRRPGDHVDAHVAGDDLLRRRHVRVARAGDLGDGRNGLRSVRERADSLRAAHRIDLVDAGDLAGGEMAASSVPSLVGGVTHTILSTPATLAGSAFMSTVDGYSARPPGT